MELYLIMNLDRGTQLALLHKHILTNYNNHSMNREEELTDILKKVEWGQMDSTVAFDRILRLFGVGDSFPFVHEVIENRIKHFESIYHTYEANELKHALNSIQRLIPPIMFKIGCGTDR